MPLFRFDVSGPVADRARRYVEDTEGMILPTPGFTVSVDEDMVFADEERTVWVLAWVRVPDSSKDITCPECGAPTYGTVGKDIWYHCTGCSWVGRVVPKEVTP